MGFKINLPRLIPEGPPQPPKNILPEGGIGSGEHPPVANDVVASMAADALRTGAKKLPSEIWSIPNLLSNENVMDLPMANRGGMTARDYFVNAETAFETAFNSLPNESKRLLNRNFDLDRNGKMDRLEMAALVVAADHLHSKNPEMSFNEMLANPAALRAEQTRVKRILPIDDYLDGGHVAAAAPEKPAPTAPRAQRHTPLTFEAAFGDIPKPDFSPSDTPVSLDAMREKYPKADPAALAHAVDSANEALKTANAMRDAGHGLAAAKPHSSGKGVSR